MGPSAFYWLFWMFLKGMFLSLIRAEASFQIWHTAHSTGPRMVFNGRQARKVLLGQLPVAVFGVVSDFFCEGNVSFVHPARDTFSNSLVVSSARHRTRMVFIGRHGRKVLLGQLPVIAVAAASGSELSLPLQLNFPSILARSRIRCRI